MQIKIVKNGVLETHNAKYLIDCMKKTYALWCILGASFHVLNNIGYRVCYYHLFPVLIFFFGYHVTISAQRHDSL